MRQGALLLTIFLTALIAGCGGAGSYTKSLDSSTNTSASSVGSAGTTNTSAGAGTSGSSSAPGSSSSSGSSAAGGSSSGSASGGTTNGGSSTGGSSTSDPPAAPAPSPSSATQVVISFPAEGAAVSSPTQVSAAASGGAPITSMQVYVDDGVAFQAASAQINASVPIPPGPHTIVVQAWDQNGSAFKSAPLHVVVQAAAAPPAPSPAPAPAPAPSAPAPTIGQIQTQGGWDDCDVCAGDAGNGPHTAHGMQRGISSPSLSGASTRFDIGGTSWGAALFWLELGSHDDAQNLRYDLDFYIDSTSSAQALEFDVNQTANGNKYIFGTECDFRNTGTWRVWNGPAHTWASTGVGCPMPDAGSWHHLTWEFQRSGGQAHFIAVTLDGNRHDVGMTFDGLGQSGSGLDVAFQADLNAAGGNVSVWLDNVSLSW